MTRADERFALSLVSTTRSALGYFDAHGRYRAVAADEGESSQELLLRLGARAPRDLEWQVELGGASYRMHAGDFSESALGVGDAIARGRYTLRQESMPHEAWPLPAVAFGLALRAPLGTLADGRSQGFGSGGAQLGLGAWELGASADASRSLLPELALSLAGEVAYRFADHVLGPERRLGSRADLTLGLSALPSDAFSVTLALHARVTADVTFDGRRLEGTGERQATAVVGIGHFDQRSRVRTSITLSVDPPWRLLGQSSTSTVAASCALGYGF